MSGPLTINERLTIPPEALMRALSELEIEKYVILCGKCEFPMERRSVLLQFEFGSAYSSEYHCSNPRCTNKLLPTPMGPAFGRIINRKPV